MLSPLLWLTPTAKDLLRSTSQLLAGAVPCPAAKLAAALRAAEDSQCTGLLAGDAALRKEFAAHIDKASLGEISDKTVSGLVDAFGVVLENRVKAIQTKAAPVKKALPAKGPMPGYKEMLALLPKGVEPGEALRRDWWISHAVGCSHSPKDLAEPAGGVVREWLATAACAGSGPVADSALALHVLENLDAYIKWETALPANQPPAKKSKDLQGIEVLTPFDKNTAKEVALRRVLAQALLPEVAASAASAGGDIKAVLKKMAESARAEAVIPMYSAPVAPKEPKAKKGDAAKEDKKGEGKQEKKGEDKKGEGKQEKKGEEAKPEKKGAAGNAGQAPATGLAAILKSNATSELQWNLLAYQLHRKTSLSDTTATTASAAAKPAAGGKVAAPVSAVSAVTATTSPNGFAGTWAPAAGLVPPGHTSSTWGQGVLGGGFASTWAPLGPQCPPGHTAATWDRGGRSGGATASSSTPSSVIKAATPVSSPATKPAKAPAAPAAAKAAVVPAAPAPAAAAGGGGGATPAEGSDEAALCKIDVRCGKILECGRVPDADSLYLLKVDVGEKEPRQVVSSLVKFYKEGELKNRQVMVYCNIKPGKMRGFDSQAMVLAATTDKGTDQERCELLAPPKGAVEGAHPMCGDYEVGSQSASQNVKNISKVWGKVQPLLTTNGKGEATFSGTKITMNGSSITVPKLTEAPIF